MKVFKKALEDFTLAIELDKDNAVGYLNRGIAFKLEGINEKAAIDFQEFLRLSTHNTRTVIQIKNWLKKMHYPLQRAK
jgi:lipoprotein NlpI